jgi:hypothetical protein
MQQVGGPDMSDALVQQWNVQFMGDIIAIP